MYLSKYFFQVKAPGIFLKAGDNLCDERRAHLNVSPGHVMWGRGVEGDEVLFNVGSGNSIFLQVFQQWHGTVGPGCTVRHFHFPKVHPAAGLDDEDLGLVLEVEAVTIVEDAKDSVIRQHVGLF